MSTPRMLTKHDIYLRLREAIVEGDLAPGEHLTEESLAARFASSRTPVREALAKLAADGLIVQRPHRGAVVRHFTVQELVDIYDLRIMLEGYAARRAAQRMTDEEIAEIVHLHEMELQVDTLSHSDDPHTRHAAVRQTLHLNERFHHLVARAARNLHALEQIERLHYLPLIYRSMLLFGPAGREISMRHHAQLIQSFQSRDAEYAETVMRLHIYHGRQALLAYAGENNGKEQPADRQHGG